MPFDLGGSLIEVLRGLNYPATGKMGPTEECFIKAVDIAYHVSILTDEGRSLRPRFVLSRCDRAISWSIRSRFDPAIKITDTSQVSKLAPAVSDARGALWISAAKAALVD